jgi:cytochrome d ubiquinol oxidase subunit I
MLISGDWAANFLAKHQKAKLAAAEAHFNTMAGAPLIIGGWPDPKTGEVHFGIEIPYLLSLFAHRDPDAVVTGLNDFPPDERPDPRLVHPFFDLMVGSFFILALAAAWFWWRHWRHRDVAGSKGLLRLLVFASPFGLIALESGWLVTEFGRQPWIITGVMKVSEGATPNPGIGVIFLTFLIIYILLTAGLLKMLVRPKG